MRHLLTFACEGVTLGASLDAADGATGLLIVGGGAQTRIGSHRMFERLAGALAEGGTPVFRFDRRGVGDSEGVDPGFRGSAPDIAAAVAAFRAEAPHVRRLVGFGLCDGATALALFGAAGEIDAAILVNPWLVEAEPGQPPPAAIRRHYRNQLLSREGWRKLTSGSVSYIKILRGIGRIVRPTPANLAAETAAALEASRLPVALILAQRDATAVAAEAEWNAPRFAGIRSRSPAPALIDSDSHTFARPGDGDALLAATSAALDCLGCG